jgi:hypothetical protein
MGPTLALQIIANALARWVGETEGQAASRLINAVRVASVQMDVAKGLLEQAEREGLDPNDRAKLIIMARDLVKASREDVRIAAVGIATAVPAEVEKAFDDFAMAAGNAAVRIADQAKGTILGLALIAGVFLWAYLDKRAA